VVGDYTLTYSATDLSGNTGTASRTVHVVDTTAPVVTLNGGVVTVEGATAYSEAGATANDTIDGSLTVSITGSVNTTVVGDYTLIYSATDAHGNTGSTTRLVHVVDTTAPVVTSHPSNMTVEATSASGAVVTYSGTASDTVDGAVSVVFVAASGSTFGLGTTTVNYSATDAHGNHSNGSFTVTVVDTTGPPVSLTPASGMFAAGLSFTWSSTDAVSAFSTVVKIDGTQVSTANSGSMPMTLGTHTVTVTSTDSAGNSTTESQTYTCGAGIVGGNLVVMGSSGSDTITVGVNSPAVVTINGVSLSPGSIPAGGHIIVFGTGGDDVITVNSSISAEIHGGTGNDTITGGSGHDVIWGDEDNDTITGAAGNDVLVGGVGLDRLVGSAGNDILIAGNVTNDYTSLTALMAMWIAEVGNGDSTNTDTATTIETDLNGEEVADAGTDVLTGSAGADLFFIQLGDSITDLGALKKGIDLDNLETSSGDVVMVV
jgi:Ca2+-binding RTX toxin-like protein